MTYKGLTVNIKEQNRWAIHDFAVLNQHERVTGTKLVALYKLIQMRGEPIKSNDDQLNGVKALEYRDGEYVALIHTPFKKGNFFPCKLKTIALDKL